MSPDRKEHPKEKSGLHPRNKHRERYDFKLLTQTHPDLASFVKVNEYGDESIDFFNPEAVKTLNKALLKQYYDLEYWDIPKNYLCPPVPGRADYIHYIADLLRDNSPDKKIPTSITCLDVGVGANCVYPIIGTKEYGWSFIGSDIDASSLDSASKIIERNPSLPGKIELRLQNNPTNIFKGIIQKGEKIDITICNPPFHSSAEEARSGSIRKLSNLKHKNVSKATLNFGGQSNELWCEGGEEKFVANMIRESKEFADSVSWFSTLISKSANLESAYYHLKKTGATEVKTIPMRQVSKVSRIVAWRF